MCSHRLCIAAAGAGHAADCACHSICQTTRAHPAHLLLCRSAGTQLALLDRIAGTSAHARLFGARLQQLHSLREQLQAVEALGSEDARDQLQHLVDTVGPGCGSKQGCTALIMLVMKPASQHLGRSDAGGSRPADTRLLCSLVSCCILSTVVIFGWVLICRRLRPPLAVSCSS